MFLGAGDSSVISQMPVKSRTPSTDARAWTCLDHHNNAPVKCSRAYDPVESSPDRESV